MVKATQEEYNEAKNAYRELVLVQNHLRAHRKITICLPEHKQKRYTEISSRITVRLYNATNKWDQLVDKLSPKQVEVLFNELVV